VPRTPAEKAPAGSAEIPSEADSALADIAPFTVPGVERRSAIAVLAFDSLSGEPDRGFFGNAITYDLITRLSAWRDFPVVARNSSFTYKRKRVDVERVSRELGARCIDGLRESGWKE